MNDTDDVQLKAEIDSIMERVRRIMEGVDSLNAEATEETAQVEK